MRQNASFVTLNGISRLMPAWPKWGFQRWALTLALLPFVCLLALVYGIGPLLWGDELAADLGDALGRVFLVWLLCLAIAAVSWKAFIKPGR